jgi:serine phosphatase RsbU (regulator of sigma subunit)
LSVHPPTDAWVEASALASLHCCRTPEALAEAMRKELQTLLPDMAFALCVAVDGVGRKRVDIALGATCPWQPGDLVATEEWALPPEQQFEIRYQEQGVGTLLAGDPVDDTDRTMLRALLAHYGIALVNLTLNEESRQATGQYCASLQALEEGIVLFQETDPEAVKARLLSIAQAMVQATAGALYALREVGDLDSGLCLELALGIPDTLLATFRAPEDAAWPDAMLGRAAQLLERDADGNLPTLAVGCAPSVLHNIIFVPLRYHGVEAGLCVLFNACVDAEGARDLLGRLQSFGQLGAALLHRLRLEAQSSRNRSIERELQIAEAIQRRLLPTKAPATDELSFAWCSIAAQSIGGDYLDLVTSDLGDIHAVVADASGHGINSAMLMSSFRSTYRAEAPWMEPNELAGRLNEEVVHEVGATGMFITMATLRIERETRRLSMTSAGHNPVMLYRARTGAIELLESHGPPLGFIAGAEYGGLELQLESGDVLLLYTDGITEAADDDLEMFGEDRLAELLRQNAHDSATGLLSAAQGALAQFTGRQTYDDDVSLAIVKVL